MRRILLRCVFGLLACIALSAEAAPASGYWWNPAAAGTGFVIEIQGNQMFMAGFLYAASGEATWVASFGPMSTPTQYSGPLVTFSGGQTLTGNYQSPTQNPASPGNIAIGFTSDTAGTVTWPGGTIPIERFDIVPGGSTSTQPSTNPETGWWFNPNQGGRGFGIEVQNGNMYLAGYMYDPAGNPVWYLASGAMTSPASFQGEWAQFGDGETLTGPYKAPSVVKQNVGPVTLQFIDPATATLTLPNQAQISLIRYSFGVPSPVLSALSPAAATPNSLLSVTGSGIDPTANLTMTLSDNTGYNVVVPLAFASATGVKFSVPVYVDLATQSFSSGTVSLQLTQSKNGATTQSNLLPGLNIQQPPVAAGTPGTSTLSLIRVNLAEAQKLQTSIKNTAQDSPAVEAALSQQVSNLQTLVSNVQNVVQAGASFTLGIVGGVDITVNPANIGQVDTFILSTLQALANPVTGSRKSVEANSNCLGAEASAMALAMTSGSGGLDQLAQALIEAPGLSAACNTAGAFTSAYQVFAGAGGTGVGIANEIDATGGAALGAGFALFATATTNADTGLGLNALLAPQLSGQTGAVQNGIGSISGLTQPLTNQFLASTSGDITNSVGVAENLILTVAPPPTTSGTLAVSGAYVGSAYATSAVCQGGGNGGNNNNSIGLVATITTQGSTLSGNIQSTNQDGSGPLPVTGAYNASTQTWSVSTNATDTSGDLIVAAGAIVGNLMSGTLTVTNSPQDQDCPNYVTDGVFALTKQ